MITMIEHAWVEYAQKHPLLTDLQVYMDWIEAGRPQERKWLDEHPSAPSWCKSRWDRGRLLGGPKE